jgi:hypothetical protein
MGAHGGAKWVNGVHSTCGNRKLTGAITFLPGEPAAEVEDGSITDQQYVVTKMRFF